MKFILCRCCMSSSRGAPPGQERLCQCPFSQSQRLCLLDAPRHQPPSAAPPFRKAGALLFCLCYAMCLSHCAFRSVGTLQLPCLFAFGEGVVPLLSWGLPCFPRTSALTYPIALSWLVFFHSKGKCQEVNKNGDLAGSWIPLIPEMLPTCSYTASERNPVTGWATSTYRVSEKTPSSRQESMQKKLSSILKALSASLIIYLREMNKRKVFLGNPQTWESETPHAWEAQRQKVKMRQIWHSELRMR